MTMFLFYLMQKVENLTINGTQKSQHGKFQLTLTRNNMNVYKSIYIEKKTGLQIQPFYIIHKAKNIKQHGGIKGRKKRTGWLNRKNDS